MSERRRKNSSYRPRTPFFAGQLAQHPGEKVRLAGSGRPAEEQRPLPRRARTNSSTKRRRAQQRALLGRAVGAIPREGALEELGRQPQAGEEREPARIGPAGAAAHHFIAALVARVEASLAAAGRALRRAGASHRDSLVVALLEGESFTAAECAGGLHGGQRLCHRRDS